MAGILLTVLQKLQVMRKRSANRNRRQPFRNPGVPGLWLFDSSGAVRIDRDEIIYCYHNNDVTEIVYSGGRHTRAQVPLNKVEQKLCKREFYRCHRNYLVNLRIAGRCLTAEDTIDISGSARIPVSRRRKGMLMEILDSKSCDGGLSA